MWQNTGKVRYVQCRDVWEIAVKAYEVECAQLGGLNLNGKLVN